MSEPPARAGRHVATLDVLRGIAAMVVLLGHCTLVYGLPENARALIDVGLNQRAAVLIFFVLSGYVLTFAWLRLREEPRGRRVVLADRVSGFRASVRLRGRVGALSTKPRCHAPQVPGHRWSRAAVPLASVTVAADHRSLQPIEYRVNAALPALLETAGAVLLIAAFASGSADKTLLAARPMRALGHWSHGIYLIHFPVLRLAGYVLPPMSPIPATLSLAVVTVTVTCVLAMLLFRFVETPGIALGKRLSRAPLEARA